MQITKIETSIADSIMPGLLLVRIHTSEGLVGCGETYYAPHAVAAMIHDWMSHYLIGKNPLDIEAHWRFLYERSTNFGSRGTELRAISAIDLALWDIFGQATSQPVWQLLAVYRNRFVLTTAAAALLTGAPMQKRPHTPGPGMDLWEIRDR